MGRHGRVEVRSLQTGELLRTEPAYNGDVVREGKLTAWRRGLLDPNKWEYVAATDNKPEHVRRIPKKPYAFRTLDPAKPRRRRRRGGERSSTASYAAEALERNRRKIEAGES